MDIFVDENSEPLVYLLPAGRVKNHSGIRALIKKHGGETVKKYSKNVTAILVDEAGGETPNKFAVPVLKPSYIEACVEEGALLEDDDFLVAGSIQSSHRSSQQNGTVSTGSAKPRRTPFTNGEVWKMVQFADSHPEYKPEGRKLWQMGVDQGIFDRSVESLRQRWKMVIREMLSMPGGRVRLRKLAKEEAINQTPTRSESLTPTKRKGLPSSPVGSRKSNKTAPSATPTRRSNKGKEPADEQGDITDTEDESSDAIPVKPSRRKLAKRALKILQIETGQDLPVLVHAMIVASGDPVVAYRYLKSGKAPHIWSPAEDSILANPEDENLVDDLFQRYGDAAVQTRLDFLFPGQFTINEASDSETS